MTMVEWEPNWFMPNPKKGDPGSDLISSLDFPDCCGPSFKIFSGSHPSSFSIE